MIYGIYDLEDKEQVRFIGTLQEIAKEMRLNARAINNALKRHTLIRKRYELVRLEEV